jgi:hypothetical protein
MIYKHKLKNLSGHVVAQFESESATTTFWDDKVAKNGMVSGLKPERTVEANSEPYTSEDVLEEIPAVMDGDEQLSPPMVRLRAEYTIEVEDITAEVQAQAVAASVQAAINKGNAIIAKVSARNAMKQINTAETLAFVQAFGGIAQLLQLGALETAKAQVLLIQPSELVTEDDLDFVLGILNEAIG